MRGVTSDISVEAQGRLISPHSASGGLRRGRCLPLTLQPYTSTRVIGCNASPKRGQVQRQPATHPAGAVGSQTPAARWPPPCSRLPEKVSHSMLCSGKAGARIERERKSPPAATNAPAPAGLITFVARPALARPPLLRRCGRVRGNKSSAASEARSRGEPTPAAERVSLRSLPRG